MWCWCPNPAYPIHAFGFILAGAAIRHVPAQTPEEFLSRTSLRDQALRRRRRSRWW